MALPESTITAVTKGREGFEYTEEGDFRGAYGEAAVNLYRLAVIQQSLAFEIKTGMKMTRVSALKAANAALGTTYRRKQAALDHLNTLLEVAS